MLSFILEICGSFALIVGGFVFVIKAVVERKVGKILWDLYGSVSSKTNLETKESLNIFSDWPDLQGEFGGRKVYVHPHKGSKRKKRPSKTIFGTETDIEIEEDIIITTPSTVLSPDSYEYELEVPNLNKHKYNVYSQSKLSDKKKDLLFSKEVSAKIHRLIGKNQEDFRALIIEPGLMMFSIYGLEFEDEVISRNLRGLVKIARTQENSLEKEDLNENFVNPRIQRLGKKSRTTLIKTIVSLLLLGASPYLFYLTIQDFSLFFLVGGIFSAVIAIANLYVLYEIKFKYG